MKIISILLIAFAISVSAVQQKVVHGFPTEIPSQWKIMSPPNPSNYIKLWVALREKNLDELENFVLDVSDPHSENYGQHLSLDELSEWIAADDKAVNGVVEWLHTEQIDEIYVSRTKNFISFETSIENAESLIGCKFSKFAQLEAPTEYILRCTESYNVPESLAPFIEFVAPVHGFPRFTPSILRAHRAEKNRERRSILQERQNLPNVTPQLIFERYNITLGSTDLKVNNTQAVWEFTDSYDPQDLASFFQQFKPELQGQKVAGIRGNFGNQPGSGDAEAALDIEYIMAVGTYSPSYFYNYNDSDIFHAFLDWVDDLSNDPHPPLIHSVSYGEYGGAYPIGWVDRISEEWKKLGSRGITVFVASGDDGVGCNDNCNGFQFPYPSSPWITLVGSSQLQQTATGYYEIGSEFSSGGFSNDFAMPKWQQAAVDYYLKNAQQLPPPGFYNSTGRALPDVAAVGENVQIVLGGEAQPVDGTSCSSPIFAGMISLLNGWRMSVGKSPLGFINPILYDAYTADASTFFDVTVGNNSDGCCPGFPAWKGWDGVTGLGTPNFKQLFAYVQTLK